MEIGLDKLKASAGKLFLLGLFALGLAVAQIMVIAAHRIELSEPIQLDSDLSVSVPSGQGWGATISSADRRTGVLGTIRAKLVIGPLSAAEVRCTHRLIPEDQSLDQLLVGRFSRDQNSWRLHDHGEIRLANLTIHWIQATANDSPTEVFLGIGQLSPTRIIEVQVIVSDDPELARRIFMTVVNSIHFEEGSTSGGSVAALPR